MEYMKVLVPEHEGEDIDVLLNDQKNGKVGEVIVVGESGYVIVSVDLPHAETKKIEIRRTTPTHPLIVEIPVRP